MAGKATINLLASQARIATHTLDLTVPEYLPFDTKRQLRTFPTLAETLCVHFILDVTAVTATPSVTITFDGYTASGVYYNILTGAAVTATGTTVYKFSPFFNGVPNLTAHDALPEKFRVVFTHADADSITYSFDANLMY